MMTDNSATARKTAALLIAIVRIGLASTSQNVTVEILPDLRANLGNLTLAASLDFFADVVTQLGEHL